jgi:hypothetical protein
MPYGGEKNAAEVAKIERCVQGRMREGHDKVNAIRICKNAILNKGKKKSASRR